MDKVAYRLKDTYASLKEKLTSPKAIRIYDKIAKVFRTVVPIFAIYAILITFSYIFMSPILRVLVDSFKLKDDLVNPDVVWIPTKLTFMNYLDAGKALWLYRVDTANDGAVVSTLFNSAFYSTLTAILQTLVSCTAGYAFARFSFKGKKLWFAGLILAFIIPVQLLTLPRSMMLVDLMNATSSPSKFLGIKENFHVDATFSVISTLPVLLLTLLGQGINSSILTFIAFSFFKMIPLALDEAAQIDGANFFQIFYHIILKMSIPTILVIFLFAFIWNWNDTYVIGHLTAVSTGNNLAFKSLPKALSGFNRIVSQGDQMSGITSENNDSNNAGLKAAAIITSILPLLILYAFTQRKFVEGIENTGVTGV